MTSSSFSRTSREGKDYAWSRSLGSEIFPIKAQSVRKKIVSMLTTYSHSTSTLEGGELREVKSLARDV